MGVAAQFFDQRDHALGLFEIRAELGLKGDVRQIGYAVGQLLLLIGVPEEAGVVEAGAQHALVAAAHQAFGIAIGVHHRDELRRELAVGVFHREIFLVVPHHRDQHFFGQLQELRVEAAGDRRGVFGEVDQRFEQRGVGLDAHVRQLALDALAPLFGREDHEVVAQLLFVVGRGDGDFARAQPAMAARSALPERTPAISNGTISSPSSATIQRMGRMKRGPPLPVQYIVFGK